MPTYSNNNNNNWAYDRVYTTTYSSFRATPVGMLYKLKKEVLLHNKSNKKLENSVIDEEW